MNDIAELLRSMRDQREDAPKLNPKAQVEVLNDLLARYQRTNPFEVGALVTPRSDSAINGAGEPHIVLEVDDAPTRLWEPQRGGSFDGVRLDIRVASLHSSGVVAAHWVESFHFERYEPAGAAA